MASSSRAQAHANFSKLVCEGCTFFIASLPIAFVDFVKLLLPATTTMRVGHAISESAASNLAAASLGILAFNVAGQMITMAPLAAMDTIAPQAFGAGNLQGVGLAGQRAVILACLFVLPTIPLWLYAHGILEALGQPPEVAQLAARYMYCLLPGLLPLVIFEALRKALYAQQHRRPPFVAAAIAMALHLPMLELWCRAIGEFDGAPLALSCSCGTMALVQIAHVKLFCPQAHGAWPRGSQRTLLFRDGAAWKHFLTTSLAAMLSLSEWFFWELSAFHAGTLGTLPLAAYSIGYGVEPVLFMLPMGLSTGLANSVGNHLGAGQVSEAKRLTCIGLFVGALVTMFNAAVVFFGQNALAGAFSQDDDVLRAAREMWTAFVVFCGISGMFATVLVLNRGLGLGKHNAGCVLAIMWPIGCPLVLINGTSTSHVWYSISLMYVLLTSAMAGCFLCSDWKKLSEKAIAASSSNNDAAAGGGLAVGGGSELVVSTTTGSSVECGGAVQSKAAAGGLAAADSCAAAAASSESRGV